MTIRVKDYKLADCKLFRLPPIDSSELDKAIETSLIKAWQEGSSPQEVVDSILEDTGIATQLESQISANLEFQREKEIEKAESAAEQQLRILEQQKEHELQQVDQVYEPQKAEKQKTIAEKYQELSQKQQAYSASQARLDEIRSRIRSNLKQVGGQKGLETIVKLNKSIAAAPIQKTEYATAPKKEEEKPEPSYELQNIEKIIEATEAHKAEPEKQAKPKNKFYSFFTNIYNRIRGRKKDG